MQRNEALSSALQMYLKTILQLQTENQVARVKEIAERLNVTGATVSSAIKNLEERGLVNHERYGYITLSDDGRRLAECVLKRYQVIRDFLREVLQIAPATAEADACLMEHDVSPTTLDRMAAFMAFMRDRGDAAFGGFESFMSHFDTSADGRTPNCTDCLAAGVCRITGSTELVKA